MKRTFTWKKTVAAAMACMIAITGICMPFQTKAAKKNIAACFRTLTATDLEVNKRKVGGKYFSYDGECYLSQSSLKKEAVPFSSEISGSQITTNGKYAYYQNGENAIVKTHLSKNKTSTVIKDTEGQITHVYNSSVFYQVDGDDGLTTIYCYNNKKNKTKTITKSAEDISICAAGRYIVFNDTKTGELKIRDCSKGKNSVITKLSTSYAGTNGSQVIYLAYNEEKDENQLISYNIKKKKNSVLTVIPSYESGAVAYDLKSFVYESDGKYYKYEIKTKKTISINEKEYVTY